MNKSQTYRDGDTMITVSVETKSAVIDYKDILDATEVVADEFHNEAPWDSCDGYDHKVERLYRLDHDEELKNARGCCYSDGERTRIVITLGDEKDDADLLKYYRNSGASKQVAAEMVALQKQRRLDQLVKWYTNGWNWYGVKCEFEGEEASVWGIDDEDYAEEYVTHEIAGEVVYALEKAGFTVTNKPEEDEKRLTAKGQQMTAAVWREEHKRNLSAQSWK